VRIRPGHRAGWPVIDGTEGGVTSGATTRRAVSLRLQNLAASVGVVVVACLAYWAAPYNRALLEARYGASSSFSGTQFLVAAALAYGTALAAWYLGVREPAIAKSLRFWQVIGHVARSRGASSALAREDRVAVLSTILKAFFGPMMVMWAMGLATDVFARGSALLADGVPVAELWPWFDQYGFMLVFKGILLVDVLWFTVGYLVELQPLGNEIRSVDPTLAGWAAALLCYPPFNQATAAILGSELTDLPRFGDPVLQLALRIAILVLMAVYASASVALGLKASNLTHRGIVARGPYRFIRHPAYTCKNMAWWIGSAPLVSAAFAHSTVAGLQALASVAGWTLLYVLRALTEEDHLRRVDGDYAAYAAKVRWRFLPGLL
jgi:hypothetical protein